MNNRPKNATGGFEGSTEPDGDKYHQDHFADAFPIEGLGDPRDYILFDDNYQQNYVGPEDDVYWHTPEQQLPQSTSSYNNQDAGYTSTGSAGGMLLRERPLDRFAHLPSAPCLRSLDPRLCEHNPTCFPSSTIESDGPALAPRQIPDPVSEVPASNIQIGNGRINSVGEEDADLYVDQRAIFAGDRDIDLSVLRPRRIIQNPPMPHTQNPWRNPTNTSFRTGNNNVPPSPHSFGPHRVHPYAASNTRFRGSRTSTYGPHNNRLSFQEATYPTTSYGNSDFGNHRPAESAYDARFGTQMGMGPGMPTQSDPYANVPPIPFGTRQYTQNHTQPQLPLPLPLPLTADNGRHPRDREPSNPWPNAHSDGLYYIPHNAQQGTLAPNIANHFHPGTPYRAREQMNQPCGQNVQYAFEPPITSRNYPQPRNGGSIPAFPPHIEPSTRINNTSTVQYCAVERQSKTYYDAVVMIKMTEEEFSFLRPNLPRPNTFKYSDPGSRKRIRVRGDEEVELLKGHRAARGILWKGPSKRTKKYTEVAPFNQARYDKGVQRRLWKAQKQRDMEEDKEREEQSDGREDESEDVVSEGSEYEWER